jgi:hypothetical protein
MTRGLTTDRRAICDAVHERFASSPNFGSRIGRYLTTKPRTGIPDSAD